MEGQDSQLNREGMLVLAGLPCRDACGYDDIAQLPVFVPGNDSTSVAASFFLYCLLRARMRASDTSAIVTSPVAREGATRASQRASPGARAARPAASTTDTRIIARSWTARRP